MEAFEEEEQREKSNKARTEVISEHGEGQAGLCHGIPRALDQVLKAATNIDHEGQTLTMLGVEKRWTVSELCFCFRSVIT